MPCHLRCLLLDGRLLHSVSMTPAAPAHYLPTAVQLPLRLLHSDCHPAVYLSVRLLSPPLLLLPYYYLVHPLPSLLLHHRYLHLLSVPQVVQVSLLP
jgi:hypothetical protein